MDWIVVVLPIVFFAILLYFLLRVGGKYGSKSIIEATDKATKSNDRLAEAINRLADVIEKKS